LAFLAPLTGNGIDASNDRSLWVARPNGLEVLTRTGDLLEVHPGDIRTIATLGFTYLSDTGSGMASGFNDLGQLAFIATFTDGTSGVFVAQATPVPEPRAATLVAFGSVGLICRRSLAARS
jgi:hypothetical protein